MKKKMKVKNDMPAGELKQIGDFLPPPHQLLPAGETTKVTLVLDKKSVDVFKAWARQAGTKYQRMMRQVLKGYAEHYLQP